MGFSCVVIFVSWLIHNFFHDCIVNSTIFCNVSSIFIHQGSPALGLHPIAILDFLWTSMGTESNPFFQNPERGWRKESRPVRHVIANLELVSLGTECRHTRTCINRHIIEGRRIFLSQLHFLSLGNSGSTLIYSNYFSGSYSSELGNDLAMKNGGVALSHGNRSSCAASGLLGTQRNSIPSLSWPMAARQQRQNSSFLRLS